MTELEQLKKENAELKRQLEVQRFMIDNNLGMLKIIVDDKTNLKAMIRLSRAL